MVWEDVWERVWKRAGVWKGHVHACAPQRFTPNPLTYEPHVFEPHILHPTQLCPARFWTPSMYHLCPHHAHLPCRQAKVLASASPIETQQTQQLCRPKHCAVSTPRDRKTCGFKPCTHVTLVQLLLTPTPSPAPQSGQKACAVQVPMLTCPAVRPKCSHAPRPFGPSTPNE